MSSNFKRIDYTNPPLVREQILDNPFRQLDKWWQDAIDAKVRLLDAVHLASVDANNKPNSRIVLLKDFDDDGLVFYTNYQSPKACEFANNPHACMVLFWPKLERQVRVRGTVKKTTRSESEKYFATRPKGAQISAASSPQSTIVDSRAQLEEGYQKIAKQFASAELICPENWGGYRLVPNYFEFWQGRPDRLHDRFSFKKAEAKLWQIDRLAP